MEPKSIAVSFMFGAQPIQIVADVYPKANAISVYLLSEDGEIRFQPKSQEDWNNSRVILDAFYELRETPEWLEFLAKAQIIPPRLLPDYDQKEEE